MAVIKHTGISLELIEKLNNKYVIANGYLGFSSIMEELKQVDKAHFKVNGMYSIVGKEKHYTSIPNPLHIQVVANNQLLHPKTILPKHHEQSLDVETGLFTRETVYTVDNIDVTIYSEKFLDQKDLSLCYMKYNISANHNIDIELFQGIDNEFSDNYKEDFKDIEVQLNEGVFSFSAKHQKSLQPLYIVSSIQKNFSHFSRQKNSNFLENYSMELTAGEHYEIVKYAGIGTNSRKNLEKLRKAIEQKMALGYEQCYEQNKLQWKKLWKDTAIEIVNNDLVAKYSQYNLFQLLSHRPYSSQATYSSSGLTDQAISLGSEIEMFIFRYFLNTDFSHAKRLLMSRVNNLGDALKKAKKVKKKGALYSSQKTDLYLNALIVHNLDKYINQTQDTKILLSGALEMALEMREFYIDTVKINDKSTHYDILNVDSLFGEMKGINNNTLLNYLVKNTLAITISLVAKAKNMSRNEVEDFLKNKSYDDLIHKIRIVKNKLYIKSINSDNVYEMYENYFAEEKVIAIPDILALFTVVPEDFSLVEKRANYLYYQPVIKPNLYGKYFLSVNQVRLGYEKEGFKNFKSYLKQSVIDDETKNKEHLLLDLGLSGAIYNFLVYGVAALEHKGYLLTGDSLLPSDIRRLEFNVKVGKNKAYVKLKRSSIEIRWNE